MPMYVRDTSEFFILCLCHSNSLHSQIALKQLCTFSTMQILTSVMVNNRLPIGTFNFRVIWKSITKGFLGLTSVSDCRALNDGILNLLYVLLNCWQGHSIISGVSACFTSSDPDAIIHICLSLGECYFNRLLC